MGKSPTMNDVAREAGVALKTVSRYINGQTNIDPVLVERIRVAVLQLGYRRNLAAASIRPGWTSKTIGMVISDIANPYYSELASGIEQIAATRGYMLTVASSEEIGARHDQLVDRMMEQRVDGLIIVPPRDPGRGWAQVVPPVPPLVFVDRPAEFDSAGVVLADNAGGAREATAALAIAGARRIAFVGDSLEIYTMSERHRGYVDALKDARLPADRSLTYDTAHANEDAARITRHLVQSKSVDAIFAANNRAAMGALETFGALGTRIPIIGFDDFEASRLLTPPFSVVSQDVRQMGRTAAEMLLAMLDGQRLETRVKVLPTTLRLRGSERRD